MAMTLSRCRMLFAAASLLLSCGHEPQLTFGGSDAGVVSIAYLKSLCASYPVRIDGDVYIEGMVVSSDRYGGFYKALVVEDATGGMEIRLDGEKLFTRFRHGARVEVRCNALAVGLYGGAAQLGTPPAAGSSVGHIPEDEIGSRIKVMDEPARRPEAAVLTFAGITARHVGCLVRFEDVAFPEEEVGLAWCEPDRDTDRHLVDTAGDTLALRVSRYASFASDRIPDGRGAVEGILGYFNGTYLLRVFDPRNVEI